MVVEVEFTEMKLQLSYDDGAGNSGYYYCDMYPSGVKKYLASFPERFWYRMKIFRMANPPTDKVIVSGAVNSGVGSPPASLSITVKRDGSVVVPADTHIYGWSMQVTIDAITYEDNINSEAQTLIAPVPEDASLLYSVNVDGTVTVVSHAYSDSDPSYELDISAFNAPAQYVKTIYHCVAAGANDSLFRVSWFTFCLVDTILITESYQTGRMIEGAVTGLLTLGTAASGQYAGLIGKILEYLKKPELFTLDIPIQEYFKAVSV